MVKIKRFRELRSAKIIQYMIRERAALRQWSADVIGRATRCWIARVKLRRAHIRRSVLRPRGSLSPRARGLPESKSKVFTAVSIMLSSRGALAREGRWRNAGPAVFPRPRRGNFRVKDKVDRSLPRASSLSHLIGARGSKTIHDTAGVSAGGATAWPNKSRTGIDSDRFSTGVRMATEYERGAAKRRRASMLGPRETKEAAFKHEMMMAQALANIPIDSAEFKKLTVREKHLVRQIQFEAQKQKRRRVVEEMRQRKVWSVR